MVHGACNIWYVTRYMGHGTAEGRVHESVIIGLYLVNDFNNSLVEILETRSYVSEVGRDEPPDTIMALIVGMVGFFDN